MLSANFTRENERASVCVCVMITEYLKAKVGLYLSAFKVKRKKILKK